MPGCVVLSDYESIAQCIYSGGEDVLRIREKDGPAAKVRRTMENVLTLDTCRYRIRGEEMSEEMQLWKAQEKIRERLQMQQIYYNCTPQRYFWMKTPCEEDETPFELEFDFPCKMLKDHKYILKMREYRATLGIVRLNGETAGYLVGNTVDSLELTKYVKREAGRELSEAK